MILVYVRAFDFATGRAAISDNRTEMRLRIGVAVAFADEPCAHRFGLSYKIAGSMIRPPFRYLNGDRHCFRIAANRFMTCDSLHL